MATKNYDNLVVKAKKALAPGTHQFTEDSGVVVVLAGPAPRGKGTAKLEASIAADGRKYLRTLLVTVNVIALENKAAYKVAKASGNKEAMLQCLLKRQVVVTDANVALIPSFQIGQAVSSITVLPSLNDDKTQVVGKNGALAGAPLFRASTLTVFAPVSEDLDDEDDEPETEDLPEEEEEEEAA